jgi:hypothetical protein
VSLPAQIRAIGACWIGLLATGATTARATDLTVRLVVSWEDQVSGVASMGTSLFPEVVFAGDRIIVSISPGMAPNIARDRLDACGKTSKTPTEFMECRRSAGFIMPPKHNIAVFLPPDGGPWKCSSTQELNERSYRICASLRMLAGYSFQMTYELDTDESGLLIRRQISGTVEVEGEKCTAQMSEASRNYHDKPKEMIRSMEFDSQICNIQGW